MSPVGRSHIDADQLRLCTRVARMYHELGMRQAEIASTLHLSQPRVSRLLKSAETSGIVRTIVTTPEGVFPEVEEALQRRYGLNEAIIVETPDNDNLLLPTLGSAGATYLSTTLLGHETIGISSWSATLLAIVEALPDAQKKVADQVVQLVGGNSVSSVLLQANRLVSRLAVSTGAQPIFLNAPGLLSTPADVKSLLATPSLNTVLTAWQRLTLVLVGIGSINPSPLAKESGNVFGPADLQKLSDLGAIGDICFRFFDPDGELVRSDLLDTVVGIQPSLLKTVPRRVGIAGGPRKAVAIKAALRGKWINTLITDLNTAEFLLED